MSIATASAYITRVDRDGKDTRGNHRWRIFFRRTPDGIETSARTRGNITDSMADLGPGSRANLITDGRGSIIAIDQTGD